MEGTRVTVRVERSQPTLAVLQEFVGGRLERQWWSRAYELAAPTVGVVTGRVRLANSAVREEVMASTMAKGA